MATESARLPRLSRRAPAQRPSFLYRQIVEAAHEGIWIHDLAGDTTYANAQMADLLGYPLDQMHDVSIFDLLDDEGKVQARGMLERELASPLTEQVDCRYVRKDGSTVWCLVNRSPLRDDDGRHVGCINLVSDITERTRVDERVRHSGELLAEAQRVAHVGSWSWEVDQESLEWSDELYRILGIYPSAAEPTLQGYLDSIHPADRDMVTTSMARCIDDATELAYECRVVRPGGQVIWVRAEGDVVLDATGAIQSLQGTIQDVTDYKLAQEEVQRTSSRYRLLERMGTEANKDLPFESVLSLAVQEVLRHTGWPAGWVFTVSGQPPRLMGTPGPPRGREDGLAPTLSADVLTTATPAWRVPPPSGDDPGSGFAFPVLVYGDVVAVLEFAAPGTVERDDVLLETCEQVGRQLARVVQRQRAAADLAAARDAAVESLQVKSEFLATMSHEIRTPMNGVIGLTNLLLDTQLDERQRQYAEGVHQSGEALLTVINDILDFSKLEAGKVELDYEDFEVRRVVEEVAALLAPTAYAKDLELLAYCLPDVPPVLVGDSGRIRQIVLNLVSNGVKFAAAGEVVTTVSATLLEGGAVSLRFEVRDTGIGIPEQSRVRLFESFSQADTSTTRRYGGTGLGLAISQRLVEAMGGTIGFESEVGVGSTFWFEIPLALGTGRPGEALPLVPELLADLPVLVVDDNATNRMILESQLGSWQLRPDSVDGAAAALTQLRTKAGQGEPYAIAVLDMCMPDMDGLQLAEQISADPALAGIRMIMLTSTSELDPAALTRAGVTEMLLKPVRSADLYDRLQRLVAPQVRTQPVGPSAEQQRRPVDGPSLGHILVVEDNPLNQLVAAGILTTLGYTADVVDDGAEALRVLLHTSYAAVLMDCHMPVLDGFEATREIRRREAGAVHLPIIAMTAGAMAEDRDRCAAAGMDDFISKPVMLSAVETTLAQWVGARDDGSVEAPSTDTGGLALDDEPALDLNRITQLRQLGAMGGTDLLTRVVGLFARDGETGLAAIREAAEASSAADLQAALHKLKGTSANMGANRVAALCRQLEEQTGADGGGGATTTVQVTTRQLDQLERELASANRAIAQAV